MNIASARLHNQQIAGSRLESAKEVVAWMGAMQAQDLAMAKWAVGVRLPGSTIAHIEEAINRGEIIRTHVMRPTWHFVAADDVYWMLALTAPQIRASLVARHRQLELTDSVLRKSTKILEQSLQGGKQLPRDVLVAEFEKAGIADEDNRAAHLLMWAELEGIICSGTTSGARQSYALLQERVPAAKRLSREESLATLVKRYFTSHGPATLQDFIWWSGLYVRDATRALEMVMPELVEEAIGSQTYWRDGCTLASASPDQEAHLLPAYDEFVISYKDRGAFMPVEDHHRAISSNGVFRPVIVVDDQVTGIWSRTTKGRKVELEAESFDQPAESLKERIAKAALSYGRFLEKEVVLRFKDGRS